MAYQIDKKRQMSLVIMTLLAIACIFVLEKTTTDRKVAAYDTKKTAADLADRAFNELKEYQRTTFGPLTDRQLRNDPAETYLVTSLPNGRTKTPIVTAAGQGVASKQRVINPNVAAVIVEYLRQMGLERGDEVAVSLTGSYPGYNINTFAAIEAMGLKATVITAVGGSPFGATNPDFTWLDMERVLIEKNIFSTRSAAASPGGASDMAGSLSDEGHQMIWDAIARNNVMPIRSDNLEASIARRMAIYERGGNADYKAYINVSSSIASLGSPLSRVPIDTGINLDLWSRTWPRKGTMILMADKGMPVLHLASSLEMAREYGFPTSHEEGFVPEVGEGTALTYKAYNLGITAAIFVVYLILTVFFTLPDLKNRFLGKRSEEA